MEKKTTTALTLSDVITTAIKVPGIKVSRNAFLQEIFKDESQERISEIIELGPVEANCGQKELKKLATKIINERTLFSSSASFLAGIPGGVAMAATIPADLLQFYGIALRMAQELAYLYGEPDLWEGDLPDSEKVTNQLILYCGVMLGASGASQAVRVLSASLAKQVIKKLPQKALTKTFYYPIVKSIAKAFSVKMTKEVFAKGVSKALPLIGGVISGGLTLATMKPMGVRLLNTLDEAHFDYTHEEFEADLNKIVEISSEDIEEAEPVSKETSSSESIMDEINKAKELNNQGIITDEEFAEIKAKLIAKL